VRLRVAGAVPRAGFLVANHVSWLDIFALNAVAPAAFVSKDDVRSWPLIGWLSIHNETLFLERGSRSAAMRAKQRIAAKLRQGACVAVFPEGTTTEGEQVLPFHSALFESAIEAGTAVCPVALAYSARDGSPSSAAAYAGDTTMWQSLRAVLAAGSLTVHVAFLPAVDAVGADRRMLAHRAHGAVAHWLRYPGANADPGEPNLPDANRLGAEAPLAAPADSFA
jgi:1-acyl-sn-glycerol-3-phosphate acyltransferase